MRSAVSELWHAPAVLLRSVLDDDDRLARLTSILATSLPILFLVLGVFGAWPLVDDLPIDSSVGDDWLSYKIFAHTILREGLAMPSIGPYVGTVHGFLYSYFVAGVFVVFGENTAYVYVVQSALLGAGVASLYLLSRRHLSPPAGLLFLVAGTLLVFLDIYRNITFRLLPENTLAFLAPVFLATFIAAHEGGSRVLAGMAGVVLGGLVLIRPNAAAAGLGVLAAGWAYRALQRHDRAVPLIATASFALMIALFPLREYAATGHPDLELFSLRGQIVRGEAGSPLPQDDSLPAWVDHYSRRALFTLGFTTAVEPQYRWRPHWLILWLVFAAYAGWRAFLRRAPFWEICCALFLVLYLGPVLAVGFPSNYGARFIVVVLPIVLLLDMVLIDHLAWGRRARARSLS